MTDLEFDTLFELSPHQGSFFREFMRVYDIRGKDILELGGAMPRKLVLDFCQANSWTCVQSEEYSKHRSDNQQPSQSDSSAGYRFYFTQAEEFCEEHKQKYDAVFSIAAFEHFLHLPKVLRLLPNLLKPEGVLFSIFAPIWSGPYGQHFTHILPERFKASNSEFTGTQQLFDTPWDHLLLSSSQYLHRYSEKFDREFAELLTYETFHSPQINRLFLDDYRLIARDANFKSKILVPQFILPIELQEFYRKQLETLQVKFKTASYDDFISAGVYLFFTK